VHEQFVAADGEVLIRGPHVFLGYFRDEAATRELIASENRRYARRQLIWFRKEPNLQWIHAAGERDETMEEATRVLAAMEIRPDATNP
jgi:tRNA A37 N6-isopentenylltransferase MiaA